MADSAFSANQNDVDGVRIGGVMFDVDGCLMLSERPGGEDGRPLPGAVEALAALRDAGIPYVVFTNGSSRRPEEIAAELRERGLDVRDDEMLTPSVVAAHVVRDRHPGGRVLAFGGAGVVEPLRAEGVDVIDVDQAIAEGPGVVDAVVVGWDTAFGRAKVQVATEALQAGAVLYCTSDAPAFASAGRLNVGVSGFIAAGLQHVSGKGYEVVGKPSIEAMREISRRVDRDPGEILVVGDDMTLECGMARSTGALAMLTTTGMATRLDAEQADETQRPHWIVDSMHEFVTVATPLLSTRGQMSARR